MQKSMVLDGWVDRYCFKDCLIQSKIGLKKFASRCEKSWLTTVFYGMIYYTYVYKTRIFKNFGDWANGSRKCNKFEQNSPRKCTEFVKKYVTGWVDG